MADIYKSKYTGEQIEEMLENASRVAKVEANPTGEATEELTKITIGDTTYSIPEGTEGTVVEGNPSGDATVELTKLKIGDTIYSIPQGSGGEGKRGFTVRLQTAGTLRKMYLADGTVKTSGFTYGTTVDNVVGIECQKTQYDVIYTPPALLLKGTTIKSFGSTNSALAQDTSAGSASTYYLIPLGDGTWNEFYN